MATLAASADLEPFHDDFWILEGRIVDDMLTSMRADGRSVAARFLNGSSFGTYHDQIVYNNWILVEQRRQPGRYAHVRTVDVEKLASQRWPHLHLERHLSRLRVSMLGPTLARLHAAIVLGMDRTNASQPERRRVRSELIELLPEVLLHSGQEPTILPA